MNKEIVDFTETQLRDIFSKAGLNSWGIENAIVDYKRYRESEIFSLPLSLLSYKELQTLGADTFAEEVFKLKQGDEIVDDILRHYARYLNYKKEMAETYQESKDWNTVFSTSVYLDVSESKEAFIDFVEETYQTKVKDAKHLQELTNITHIFSYYEKGKDIEIKEEAKQKEQAIKELEETLTDGRETKYLRALNKALQEGAKYKDLLNINAKDYGLPESWGSRYGEPNTAYSSMLGAISFEFLINEPGGLMLLPDLRSIAKDLEAPYSVLMDSYKLTNRR